MPIYAPGIRKKNQSFQRKDRNIVVLLQLTAMVDMFTVLVVFLLQNYAVTNRILPISEDIKLPEARQVKSLKPSHLVILSEGKVILNEKNLGDLYTQRSTQDWVFLPLKKEMEVLLKRAEKGEDRFLILQIKKLRKEDNIEIEKAPFRVTIQAAEETPFLDIKRIMYTLTEAGVKEMNFAVVKASEFKK